MTLYEFLMLNDKDQWDTIWTKGKFVDIHIEGNTKLVLYAIDRFFVEVEWDVEKDEIVSKGDFKCGATLDRYSNVLKKI